ncbi:hypothetical protein Y1Q_0008787 [Alligator mississippiensis]|uniref:Uncharacterized protein n=1 Tax=Alligator mississippiensis TaxID=8496 RepID=A0A151NA55_ALLMI|nr:hypothetical protein Y1Q_0008787 [Alligator mississippiensis]
MFSTYSEQQKTIAIAASDPMLADDAIPCLAIRANPGIEVAKENETFRLWYSSDRGVEVIIELVLDFVRVGHADTCFPFGFAAMTTPEECVTIFSFIRLKSD